MNRRKLLKIAGGGLVALIGTGAALSTMLPVFPKRPEPDAEAAIGWIRYSEGRFELTLPRIEMGQNISTALKQISCSELGVKWEQIDVIFHDTELQRVKSTVGSESIMHFAEPLAQACAALREALANGETDGQIKVVNRPVEQLRSFQSLGLIGQNTQITHGLEIVTGQKLYAGDIRRPGMLFGRVLRAPASVELASYPKDWNEQNAKSIAGFVSVVEECGPPVGKAQGLGIVARRPGLLDKIVDALEVEWAIEESNQNQDISKLIDIDQRLAEGELPNIVLDGQPVEDDWDLDLRIDVPPAAHRPIEGRTAVAEWNGDHLDVWAGSQDAFFARDLLADLFDLSQDNVKVNSCRVGGAFGGKVLCFSELEAAALARAVKAPVKVQRTHQQEFATAYHRPPSSHRVKLRLNNGKVTDWDHSKVGSHVLFTPAGLNKWIQYGTDLLIGDPGMARGLEPPYDLGAARVSYDLLRLPIHTGPWRGLGAGPNGLVIESVLDEAAIKSKSDPLAFRLAHINDPRLETVLRRVGEIANWEVKPSAPKGKKAGRGIACGIYKKTSYAAVVADILIDDQGQVELTKFWCVHDCGLVINPDQVRAQCEGNLTWSIGMIFSDGLTIEDGHITTESLVDAPIPKLNEIPEIEIELVESNKPPSGAGETAIVAGPGAIANAIRDATGHRVRHFPVQSDDLVG